MILILTRLLQVQVYRFQDYMSFPVIFAFLINHTSEELALLIIPSTEALISKLDGLKCPCVVNVKASAIFEPLKVSKL